MVDKKGKEISRVPLREVHSVDHLLSIGQGSVFLLARIAMKRAMEIHMGSPPLVDFLVNEKETSIALREMAEGKISLKKTESK